MDYPGGHLGNATTAPKAMKLDKAAEAIRVLDATRQFWTETWEEAKPVAAAEQDALFDAASTVEMCIDYLQTIHPATLLCQVAAVNLAMAYYTLVVSAGDAVKVGAVRVSLVRFRENVVSTLEHLSHDVTFGDSVPQFAVESGEEMDNMSMLVSVASLSAYGRACLSLSEAEVVVSRATSLLCKLPQQYELVDKIMSQPNGAPIEIADRKVRNTILSAVSDGVLSARELKRGAAPAPSVREYTLMNDNDMLPCQLTVRYYDDGAKSGDKDCTDLIVALTTSTA